MHLVCQGHGRNSANGRDDRVEQVVTQLIGDTLDTKHLEDDGVKVAETSDLSAYVHT